MTYDLYIAPVDVEDQYDLRGAYSYVFDKTVGVKGFTRLITRWSLEFLTLRGSDPLDRERGTLFASLIGSNVSSEDDIEDVCRTAVARATQRILLYSADSPPASLDETLNSVEVEQINFTASSTGFDLYVRIKNAAGTVHVFKI